MEPAASLKAPESLRTRVVESIRKHWVTLRAPATPDPAAPPLPEPQVDELGRATLDVMLTRQFRIGPLPPPEIYDQLLEKVRRRIRKNQPIKVHVGYGPMKNQHAVPYSRADWAEFFALSHLAAWHNKVQAVYPLGLAIQIVFDDSTIAMANRGDKSLMRSYMDSVAELIRALGYDSVLRKPYGQSCFSWVLHFGFYQVARWRVWRWERNPANREQIERMLEYARRNVMVPAGLTPEEQERYIGRAAHRYRLYWDALQFGGFTRTKGRIVGMYLDGTQHHIRQPVAFHLTTLDKGQVTQPWQGEGALLDNAHGKLEPFVLTAGRRARYEAVTVEGLDVLPVANFDRIAVVRQAAPAGGNAAVEPAPIPRAS
jgi:hypothetical protein